MHVRVRRDADEQLVLAHVSNRLSNIIAVLTVQIFKDDWTRSSTYQILGDTSLMNKLPSPARPAGGPSGVVGAGGSDSVLPPGGSLPHPLYPSPLKIGMPSHASSARTNFLLSSPGAVQTPYARSQYGTLPYASMNSSMGAPQAPRQFSMDSLSNSSPSMNIVGAGSDTHSHSHSHSHNSGHGHSHEHS